MKHILTLFAALGLIFLLISPGQASAAWNMNSDAFGSTQIQSISAYGPNAQRVAYWETGTNTAYDFKDSQRISYFEIYGIVDRMKLYGYTVDNTTLRASIEIDGLNVDASTNEAVSIDFPVAPPKIDYKMRVNLPVTLESGEYSIKIILQGKYVVDNQWYDIQTLTLKTSQETESPSFGGMWGLVIVLVAIFVIAAVAAMSGGSLSLNLFISMIAIAVVVSCWAGILPDWAMILTVGILALQILKRGD
jgi:hypothetical protein